MEQTYKFALEIIFKLCKKESYGDKEDIKMICETVLKESTDNCDRGESDACS